MPRSCKLNTAQCQDIISKRQKGIPVPRLARRHKVSQASIYKVLGGSYSTCKQLPQFKPVEGSTPSMFKQDPSMLAMLNLAAQMDDVDSIILAAAQLIVAKANYQRFKPIHH